MRTTLWLACAGVTGIVTAGSAQTRPIVMIDPGHGGEQNGVEVPDVLEKDVALRAAFSLGSELVMRGLDVRLTRSGDYDIPFNDRRTIAEEASAALFVSLHFNGDEDVTAHGIELYANLDNAASAAAAAAVAEALRELGTPVVVESRPWEFLASPTVPMIMLEAGFLTNPVERRLLLSPAYHDELAEKIAQGAVAFLERRR